MSLRSFRFMGLGTWFQSKFVCNCVDVSVMLPPSHSLLPSPSSSPRPLFSSSFFSFLISHSLLSSMPIFTPPCDIYLGTNPHLRLRCLITLQHSRALDQSFPAQKRETEAEHFALYEMRDSAREERKGERGERERVRVRERERERGSE